MVTKKWGNHKKWRTDYLREVCNEEYHRGRDGKGKNGGKDYGPIIHELVNELNGREADYYERAIAKHEREEWEHQRALIIEHRERTCSKCGVSKPLTPGTWPLVGLFRGPQTRVNCVCSDCRASHMRDYRKAGKVPF
jgi:hypothetical protein